MKISEKLELISKVSRELQSRFSYTEIDTFLKEYAIDAPTNWEGSNSKRLYSKAALRGVKNDVLKKIANELGIENPTRMQAYSAPPKNWKGASQFRLFISHISKDKTKATRLKECLASYSISGFVAHEDIHPTLEWQAEIERALFTMDALVAIHTPGFSKSIWTQQEIGFALGRGAKVISLRMGEDPTGFISKQQAIPRQNRTAEQISTEIDKLLGEDELTSKRLHEAKKAGGLLEANLEEEVPF